MNYYLKFVQNYPTVTDLANAPEEKVLKDWQGLGYYSRARNLHAAAKEIVTRYGGKFPADYESVRSLKGVGDYTAAAITSIAYGLPHPVLDGNVYRVISRIFGIEIPVDTPAGKKEVQDALRSVFDPEHPAEFNQGMMEFGALFCVPRNPDCPRCIFFAECEARRKGLVNKLPAKSKTTRIRNRYFYYLVIEHDENIYLEKRTGKDIWEGLFQFPLLEAEARLSLKQVEEHPAVRGLFGADLSTRQASVEYKHVLSHQHLYATFVVISTGKDFRPRPGWVAVKKEDLEIYAVPRLVHRFLEAYLPGQNRLF